MEAKEIKNPNWITVDGKWHHITQVSDDKELKTYLDGKITIMEGIIDNVQVFDYELNPYQVFEMYHSRPPKWYEKVKINIRGLYVLYFK